MRSLGIILLSCFLFSFEMEKNSNKSFYIIFGSGFHQDTVSLVINEVKIAEDVVLLSDSITGIGRGASIQLKNDSLQLLDQELNLIVRRPFKFSKELRIIVTINDRSYELFADLRRGKYIVISKHWYYYNVYINQYKKPISFE
jgi:hypothetical protein